MDSKTKIVIVFAALAIVLALGNDQYSLSLCKEENGWSLCSSWNAECDTLTNGLCTCRFQCVADCSRQFKEFSDERNKCLQTCITACYDQYGISK